MATVAILDEYLLAQWRERPDALAPVELSWAGTDLEALRQFLMHDQPTILALDIELLGDAPLEEVARLSAKAQPELVLLLHRFAKRETLREAARAGVRPIKSPIRLDALRTHMTSVVVREILDVTKPAAPAIVESSVRPPSTRFSRAQLGRLAEIQSSIACECPNHLSELLISLIAFEEYSRACENRNDADAKMHAQLADATGRARAIMEDALGKLLVHERIVL